MTIVGAVGDPGLINWVSYALILGAAAVVSGLLRRHGASQGKGWAASLQVVVWAMALVVVVMMIASRGASLTLLLVLLAAVIGAVLALDWLRDVVAGVVLVLQGRSEIGEVVEVDGYRGTVHQWGVGGLTLKTGDGRRVEVRNRRLLRTTVLRGDGAEKQPCRCRLALCEAPEEAEIDELRELRRVASCTPYGAAARRAEVYLEYDEKQRRWSVVVEAYPAEEGVRQRFKARLMLRLRRWMEGRGLTGE